MTSLLLHAGLGVLALLTAAVIVWGAGTSALARADARRGVHCPRCGPERFDALGDVSEITGQLERVRGPALPASVRSARKAARRTRVQ
jgi:hypothetical protein